LFFLAVKFFLYSCVSRGVKLSGLVYSLCPEHQQETYPRSFDLASATFQGEGRQQLVVHETVEDLHFL
jgi:hypothetical protein